MRRMTQMMVIAGLLLALTATSAFAQCGWRGGRGPGWCRGNGNAGGCWMTRVNPTDPKQKAFVEQLARLQSQVRAEQLALRTLQTSAADAKTIEAQQAVLDTVRGELRKFLDVNRGLHQQIAQQYGSCRGCGFCQFACVADCPTHCALAPGCGVCPQCPWTK
ncbi:MAG: hypothetical protein FJ388_21360 [Verrucomicrobia bacterium]|nr:hypothetical protein [Verrucomicrobiota bacterium]